jgi:DNA-binding transcriptional ArsR family regulator
MEGSQNQSDVFAAISTPVRREILGLLAEKEMPVMEIAKSFDMSLSAVSQHLSILKNAELVQIRKVGRQRVYRLTPNPLMSVADWIRGYERFWSGKLRRLETYLEEDHE